MPKADQPSASIRVLGAPKRFADAARESRARSDAPSVETVADGSVPPATRHGIPPFDPAGDWLFKGWKAGVYRADRTVCEASLLDRWHTKVTASYAPAEIAGADLRYIPGDAVYGGLLIRHFGHFLLESTNRLWWPLLERFDGPIVFQAVGRRPKEPGFVFELFDLLGIADRVLIAHDAGYRFDRVIVPERSFVIKTHWHEAFRVPFRVAGAEADRRAAPVPEHADMTGLYLSRTRYDFRRSFGEDRLERAFARNGFTIAHPETLPLAQQIRLVRRHRTIAGIQGSAFHTLLFADDPREAVYVCRDYDVNLNYFMIDEMMSNAATYIYSGVARDALAPRVDRDAIGEDYRQDVALDLEKIFWMLERPAVFAGGWSRRGT